MSYTTRCPACGTTFRVVPDQLKISDGWVRCGHCADVFDATLYLEAWTPPPAAPVSEDAPQTEQPAPQSVPESAPEPAPPDVALAADEPGAVEAVEVASADLALASPSDADDWLDLTAPDDALGPPEPVQASVVDAAVAGEQPPVPGAEEDFHAELARFAAASGRVPSESAEPVAPVVVVAAVVAAEPDEVETKAVLAEAMADEPGFMRQARRQAFWRSPVVRSGLAVLVLLLSGLLAMQWTVQERDRLAARHPDLAPLLGQLCEPLGCRIAPPRHIHAVVIDSTTLARRLGNFYAFDVVIRNTADLPLAMPALELSLTDTRDQVIARRVFLPSELPDAPTQLPALGAVPLSLRLSITEAGAIPMAGYRALVFYP